MSFVNAQPEALTFAASKLEGIGSSLAAQNASAAAPTTGVVPAAADEVSALQATQFTAYGNLYQQVSTQATAINQAFVQMLGLSGNSYGATEAANSAATGTGSLGGLSLLGQLTQFGQFGIIPGAMSSGSMDGMYGGSPFIGAASSFLGLIPPAAVPVPAPTRPAPPARGWATWADCRSPMRRPRPPSVPRQCWRAWARPRRSAGCRYPPVGPATPSPQRAPPRQPWPTGPAPRPRTARRSPRCPAACPRWPQPAKPPAWGRRATASSPR
jgi:hypothetical protein